jgi:hypothetical protein
MADNVEAASGSGGPTFKTDEDTGVHVPVTKIELGANSSFDGYVAAANPMPSELTDGTNAVAVIATHADDTANTTNAITAAAFGYVFDGATWDRLPGNSTDGLLVNMGGNNDVTNTVLSVVGGGTEAAAQRVTIANDSTGLLSVDDNGSSLTVDTTGTSGLEVVQDTAADLNMTEASAAAIKTAVELIDDAVYTDDSGTPSKGIAVMGTDSTNPQIISTTTSGHVHIHDGGNTITVDGSVSVSGSVTVSSGTVTANAGTNLNTSALALESGNLASVLTAVQIMDDWDESDRAKVNLIVGQAGIAAGTGVDGVTVPRVTLATDIPLPAGTNAIGKLSANSGVDIGDVDVTSIAAGTNTVGGTISQPSSSVVYDGTTACTVKRFHVTTSTSDTSIITAVASKKFRVLSIAIFGLSTTATNVHLETKTSNTDCLGDSTNPIPIAVDADGDNHGGFVLDWNPGGWCQTADANEDMAIILSAAQPVLVIGNYIEVS